MSRVVTFGEIMLRLSTPGNQRFIQADCFDAIYGGGEANVAVSLAHFGLDSLFVTKVPDNPIGQSAINHLRRFGVNTEYIRKGGNRLGIYFLESGASQRPSLVVYDRANSAISEVKQGEMSWETIFDGASWFHFTGITPALSDSAAEAMLEACRAAKSMGITVSCDLNYRKKLWSQEKARQVMTGMMEFVDVVIANEEDAEKVFGIKSEASDIEKGVIDQDSYFSVAKQLHDQFNLKAVAITLRESHSASDNGWSGLLYNGQDFCLSRKYDIRIVDRVGGGDSFAGGLIYAWLQNKKPQDIIEFAVAASCLKHTISGDFNMASVSEVETLVQGDGSGRVQR
jgi:2-dehydro-3-deoxygluconokinase